MPKPKTRYFKKLKIFKCLACLQRFLPDPLA